MLSEGNRELILLVLQQIALFVIPFIITLGWIMGRPLTLLFDPFESIVRAYFKCGFFARTDGPLSTQVLFLSGKFVFTCALLFC